MKQNYIVIAIIALFILPFVNADYNRYVGAGDTTTISDYIINGAFTTSIAGSDISPTTGEYSEPISYDFDNDGNTELIYFGGDNITYMARSPNPNTIIDSVPLGDPQAIPVVCNLEGAYRYVGIFRSGTQDTLYVLDVENHSLTIKYAQNVTDTSPNITGFIGGGHSIAWNPIRCYPFYGNKYDGSNPSTLNSYAIWLDKNKTINFFTVNNGVMNLTTKDVNADFYDQNAVHPRLYSHDVVVDNTFDKGGEVTLQFIAGDMFFVMDENNDVYSSNISSKMYGSGGLLRLMGGFRNGQGGGTGTVYYSSLASASGNMVGQSYGTTSIFGNDNIQTINSSVTLIAGYNMGVGKVVKATKDDVFRIEFAAAGIQVAVLSSSTMLANQSTTLPPNALSDLYSKRLNVFAIGGKLYVPYYATLYEVNPSNITQTYRVFNTSFVGPMQGTAVPIDLDGDSYLDWFVSAPDGNAPRIFRSGITTESLTENNYPFVVTLNSTSLVPLSSDANIIVEFNDTERIYNYAVACNMNEESIWSEQFRIRYNSTDKNITFFPDAIENHMTANGLTLYLDNTTFDQYDFYKEGAEDYTGNLRQKIVMTRVGDNTLDYIAYTKDGYMTYWLRLEKNNTNIKAYKVLPGNVTNIGNYTTIGGSEDLNINFEPTYDFDNDKNYFLVSVVQNGNTIFTDDNFAYDGSSIGDVELYTETTPSSNTTVYIKQLSLNKYGVVKPEFTQFQNGIIADIRPEPTAVSLLDTILDLTNFANPAALLLNGYSSIIDTVEESQYVQVIPPPYAAVEGDGYTVLADYNDVFFSRCEYSKPGNYTQRHYIAPRDTGDDYTNYEELTVEIKTTASSADDLESKANESPISGFFFGFIKDPVTALVVGLLLSLGLSILLVFLTNWVTKGNTGGFLLVMIGGVGFVVGLIMTWAIGLTPLWVILLLVIIAAALTALAFRYAVSGA